VSDYALVAMLDLDDMTLHRPGRVHLVTACGVGPLDHCQVGPTATVRVRAKASCPECWSFRCPKCKRVSHHPDDVEARYCGACHVYLDQLLRFRLYVADQVASERWLDPFHEPTPENSAGDDAAICRRAEAAGLEWRLEIYDPSEDRTVRLASSAEPIPPGTSRLADPQLVDLDDTDALLRRMARILGYT
jgi:hypothetical protein